ncbi:hypothetical protein, partial [Sphingobacterium sp.]|uniref:hypothetical protein n=1 Tax=Sphingobacterium sp. TaxID=341027 RepID=UPI0028AB4FE1
GKPYRFFTDRSELEVSKIILVYPLIPSILVHAMILVYPLIPSILVHAMILVYPLIPSILVQNQQPYNQTLIFIFKIP